MPEGGESQSLPERAVEKPQREAEVPRSKNIVRRAITWLRRGRPDSQPSESPSEETHVEQESNRPLPEGLDERWREPYEHAERAHNRRIAEARREAQRDPSAPEGNEEHNK